MPTIKTLQNRIERLEAARQCACAPYYVLDGTETVETLVRIRSEIDAHEQAFPDGLPAFIVHLSP